MASRRSRGKQRRQRMPIAIGRRAAKPETRRFGSRAPIQCRGAVSRWEDRRGFARAHRFRPWLLPACAREAGVYAREASCEAAWGVCPYGTAAKRRAASGGVRGRCPMAGSMADEQAPAPRARHPHRTALLLRPGWPGFRRICPGLIVLWACGSLAQNAPLPGGQAAPCDGCAPAENCCPPLPQDAAGAAGTKASANSGAGAASGGASQAPSGNPGSPEQRSASGNSAAAGGSEQAVTPGQRLRNSAEQMVGNSPSDEGPDGGNKACVWNLNKVLKNGGLKTFRTLYTPDVYNELENGRGIEISQDQLQPGDIVISPTVGKNAGHIGVYMGDGQIYSNSSSRHNFLDNFTLTSWNRYYGGRGLTTRYFRLRY